MLGSNDIGRVDQVIAKAIKSRVLLYAASPLFNGNSNFYSGFVNEQGEHFFNQTEDNLKWQLAANAADDAIQAAIGQGVSMYYYSGDVPLYDEQNWQYEFIRDQYDNRFVITDPWNSELIWGSIRKH